MARVTVEDCLDKVPNRFALVVLAAERDLGRRRQVFLHLGDRLVDLGGHRSEVASFDIGGDVDHAFTFGVTRLADALARRPGP